MLSPRGTRRTLYTRSFSCPFSAWHHRPLIRWLVSVSLPIAQHLRCDLIRQFDSHVSELVDSLIEESVSLEPTPLPANFSPSMSDKERSKLRYCLRPQRPQVLLFNSSDLMPLNLVVLTLFPRSIRPPNGEGKQFVNRRSLLEWVEFSLGSERCSPLISVTITAVHPPVREMNHFQSPASHSELFEVNHIRTIYHMFIALLILFILSTLVVDFIDEGR